MIHLMLGSTFDVAVRNLMGYVLSYEDKDLSDVFTGMLCTREDDGRLVFKTTKQILLDESTAKVFNSEPDDPFKVEFGDTTVVEEKDQLDHLKSFFIRLFDKRVTINSKNREAVLNICIYLPMYDEESWKLTKLLVKAISEQNRNISVDVFMFSSDLAYLFTSEEEQAELPTKLISYEKLSRSILKDAVDFKEKSEEARKLGHIIVMQNCNGSGISLDLDWDSFVRVIGEFTIASMNSYYDIFQPNAEIEGRPIHSFGLCVLNLDKYYYVKYLLSRAYVTILEREGVNKTDIDVNEPSQIVQKSLLGDGGLYKFYDRFYEHRIMGYIAEKKQEEEINTQSMKVIDADVEKFMSKITDFLNDESLSLPTKRVALAQLLGFDDEYMTGDMFNPQQLLLRDTYSDCIEMFVSANNAFLKESPDDSLYVDIPGGKAEPQKYPETFKSFAILGNEEIHFTQMMKDLKEYDGKIRKQTEYIRTLKKELDDCDVQEKQADEKEKVLTSDGFKYGDHTYKFSKVDVVPFEKTYEPKRSTLPKNVDLRQNFTYVKEQGDFSTCTCFALGSIFEYILSKNQKLDADLSERYLYYNTRIEAQKRLGKMGQPLDDSGTSFFDAIKALSVDGICSEELCKYEESNAMNEKPSEAAYTDGRTRLVTEAKDVKLKVKDLKSALSEGYPIAVSVRIFDGFANLDHGFLSLPSEDEINQADGMDNNHAMVICGYSDESKVFVVRNSWGVEFGDKGYCFIPYSYITNPRLTNQACIITGTNLVSAEQVKCASVVDTVPFDKLNPSIKAITLRILIGEAKAEVAELVKVRTELYTASLIEKKIVSSEVRSTLTTGTIERVKWEIQEIQRQKTVNEEREEERIAALDKENKKVNISFAISLLILLVGGIYLGRTALYRIILSVIPMTKILLILVAVGFIAMIIWWIVFLKQRKAIHREHAEINEELEDLEYRRREGGSNKSEGHLHFALKGLNIRMFTAWIVVRKLSEQNRIMEQKYQVMKNYTKNLYQWYATEKDKAASDCPDTREPFISLLSNETLDKYYSKHSDEITEGVRLSSMFKEGYSISDEAIVKFQNKLKKKIMKVLDESLKDFSVYRYLTGQTAFEFAKAKTTDIHDMLTSLEEKSEVFIRIGASPVTSESINSTTTVLMSSDISKDLLTWNEEFQKDFSVPVFHIDIASPFKLSFLQMKRLPMEECLDLYDPKAPKWEDKPFEKKAKKTKKDDAVKVDEQPIEKEEVIPTEPTEEIKEGIETAETPVEVVETPASEPSTIVDDIPSTEEVVLEQEDAHVAEQADENQDAIDVPESSSTTDGESEASIEEKPFDGESLSDDIQSSVDSTETETDEDVSNVEQIESEESSEKPQQSSEENNE